MVYKFDLRDKLIQHKIKNDAKGADGYVEGVFILETKTDYSDWLAAFYQALHYHRQSKDFRKCYY